VGNWTSCPVTNGVLRGLLAEGDQQSAGPWSSGRPINAFSNKGKLTVKGCYRVAQDEEWSTLAAEAADKGTQDRYCPKAETSHAPRRRKSHL